MTGRLARVRPDRRVWAARWLTLGLALALLALATAAFALAPSSISQQVGARPDLTPLPSTQGALVAAPAARARFAVTAPAVSGGDRTALERRAGRHRRVEP